MSLQNLIESLYADTFSSALSFGPELVLCATIVLILLLRVIGWTSRINSFYVALAGSIIGLWFCWQDHARVAENSQPIFTGMLAYDSFTVYFRTVLLFFAVLFAVFTRISGIPDRGAAPDFYVLTLGATLGMCLMASANHLLIVFLGVEMASVPSYVLAGMLKGRRKSSEAALKYAVYGAGAAGIMLYGISLLAGVLGSVHIPTMAVRLAELLRPEHADVAGLGDKQMVLALGALMVMVGVAFKLSAVPFHFWCPDVFEGASAEVNAFLSVASKAAALALLVRLAIGFSQVPHTSPPSVPVALMSVADSGAADKTTDAVAEKSKRVDNGETLAPASSPQTQALAPVRQFIARLLTLIAAITCTFGNLAAYGQTNIKRLLAYSTIAQAGYMIMPVAAAVALMGSSPEQAQSAIGALTFYVAVYLFMNLGAFAIVALLRNTLHSEDIADYAGLIRRSPLVVVCFSLILFSLIGMPPLAGFWGKFLIFAWLWESGLVTLLVIAGLNTVISLLYYLRVVKVMAMDPEPDRRLPVAFTFLPSAFIIALTLPILNVWWDGLHRWALAATADLFY